MKIHRLAAVFGVSILWLAGISAKAQSMPPSILGKWRVVKILPTHNPQCWDQDQAKSMVGTTLTYQDHALIWHGGVERISDALSRRLSRRNFQEEYKVDLPELGITMASVEEIDLQHEDADVTGSTTEVPGDTVVIVGPGRIVVSACGVFYSAIRAVSKTAGAR